MEPVDFGDPRSGPLLAPYATAVDISSLKGRIGEAFVESILRQSGFKVSRLGRESQVQQLLKTGGSEFLPDFLIWKPADQSNDGLPLHRLLSVEVKYRSNVEEYLRRFGEDLISRVGEHWRELYLVFVTDHPAAGRSCFQVLDFRESSPDAPLGTMDLCEARAFGISKSIVEEHEGLVRQLFSPLSARSLGPGELRKPPARISSDRGSSIQPPPHRCFRPDVSSVRLRRRPSNTPAKLYAPKGIDSRWGLRPLLEASRVDAFHSVTTFDLVRQPVRDQTLNEHEQQPRVATSLTSPSLLDRSIR